MCLSTWYLEGSGEEDFCILESLKLLLMHSQVWFSATVSATMHPISRNNHSVDYINNHSVDYIVLNTSYACTHTFNPYVHAF